MESIPVSICVDGNTGDTHFLACPYYSDSNFPTISY